MPDTRAVGQAHAPDWPTCDQSGGDDSCDGRLVDGFDYCLGHLAPDQLAQALGRLHPGVDLDISGTPIDAELLAQVLGAVQAEDGYPTLGSVSFAQAHFTEDANFTGARFNGNAVFSRARFTGDAKFSRAQFTGNARFSQAQFKREAVFGGAQITGNAMFGGAQFTGSAGFAGARFFGDAVFGDARFGRTAMFRDAQFSGDARFACAQFTGIAIFGGQFSGRARFDSAQFAAEARFGGVQFTRAAVFGSAGFSGNAVFSSTQFTEDAIFVCAQFTGEARFGHAQFNGNTEFGGAQFNGNTEFGGAQFARAAVFGGAQFARNAVFGGAQFARNAIFADAEFTRNARFDRAQFTGDATFDRAQFTGDARFGGARFTENVTFDGVRFENATFVGPLAAGSISLRRAVFGRPLVMEATATVVSCRDTTWHSGVTLRLRYAAIDLEGATFTVPSFLAGSDQPFELTTGPLNDSWVRRRVQADRGESFGLWVPILTSLRGSDTANLTVTDIDLSQCRFAGARLLDRLRLEGRNIFDQPPRGIHIGWAWLPAWRWSDRQTLAEERSWRTTTRKYGGWADERSPEPVEVGPERLAGLYRQLRKAQEDAKYEPGAADFYYGEMEMRRKAATTPTGERVILWLYWLISGYGLRALRSLAALVILGVIVTTALTGWGLAATAPVTTPAQHLAGTVTITPHEPARIDATLRGIMPLLPPASQRWTRERTQTALEVTLDSIVFRTTDQPLTTTGIWTTIALRILGPVLLALTLLAVRNRVKR